MRKIFMLFLGGMFGLLVFAVQTRAQQPAQYPVMCGDYKELAGALAKIGEEIVGRGTNAGGVVEFWLNSKNGSGTVVLRLDIDKACMIIDVEGFKQVKAGKDA